MLGPYIMMQPDIGPMVAQCAPPVALYFQPEAGKVPYRPGLTIGRIYFDGEQQRLASDPAGFGRDAAEQCIERAKVTGIDCWMGTNEPDVSSGAAMERLVAFEREFTGRMNSAGLRCGVFSLSVGWPRQVEGTNTLDTGPLDAFLKTLGHDNFVCLHEYHAPNGVFVPFRYPEGNVITPYVEGGPSLCWRFKWWPQLQHRVVITECGMDIHGRPQTDGWRKQCPPGMNLEQWFDECVRYMDDYLALVSNDPRFLAACWFCAGQGFNWGEYNWLDHWPQAAHLLSGPAVDLPTATPDPTIKVKLTDGTIVTLPLETYLQGVVPAEIEADGPYQAVLAQAVIARTYALWRMAHPRHVSFDILADQHDQVWNPGVQDDDSDRAIKETAGIHLVNPDGTPYESHYVKFCGRTDCAFCDGVPRLRDTVFEGWACQEGLKAMAREGLNWRELAEYYYPADVRFSDGVE
jgi:hypothetical protein